MMSSLDYILDVITSDENRNDLLEVLYTDDSEINKSALLKFVSTCLGSSDMEIIEFVEMLGAEEDEYDYFLVMFQNRLISQINSDLGRNFDIFSMVGIERSIFWPMYSIAIKKCIGTEHAAEKIGETEYFYANSDELNQYQEDAHKECLRAFNMNAREFNLKNAEALGLFLHKFGSKNKSIRTRKKNLHRVERRAKKMIQVSKLAHGGKSRKMFSNKRYLVPGQFANTIVKLFL